MKGRWTGVKVVNLPPTSLGQHKPPLKPRELTLFTPRQFAPGMDPTSCALREKAVVHKCMRATAVGRS